MRKAFLVEILENTLCLLFRPILTGSKCQTPHAGFGNPTSEHIVDLLDDIDAGVVGDSLALHNHVFLEFGPAETNFHIVGGPFDVDAELERHRRFKH